MTELAANRRVLLFAVAVVLVVRLLAALPQIGPGAQAQSGTIPTPTRPGGKTPQPTRDQTASPPEPTELLETPETAEPTVPNTPAATASASPVPSGLPPVLPASATAAAGTPLPASPIPSGSSALTMTATVPATAAVPEVSTAPAGTALAPAAGAESVSPTASLQPLPTWTVAQRSGPLVDSEAGSSTLCCLWGAVSFLLVGVGIILVVRRRRAR